MLSAIFKTIVCISGVTLLITSFGSFLPTDVFQGINDTITYFLGYINYLSPLVHVSVIFDIIKYLAGFYLGLFYVLMVYGIIKLFSIGE